jgi:hypothetical protein
LSGSCDTSANHGYCKGQCTYPSAALSCDTDADCVRTTTAMNDGWTVTIHGNCVDGACECTGVSSWDGTAECVEEFEEDWYPALGHTRAAEALVDAQAMIDAEADGTPPLLLPSTIPLRIGGCQMNPSYFAKASAHILDNFPGQTWDGRGALATIPFEDGRTDGVHFSGLGAQVIGTAAGRFLAGFNTCALDPGTMAQRPQKYCQNPNGSYETTGGLGNGTCTVDGDCASDERCVLKRCRCDVDADCTAVGGGTCTAHACPNACPGAADTCNPEP